MKRAVVAAAVAVLVWTVYLVPLAAVLNVGYGPRGFRRYEPFVTAQVLGFTPGAGASVYEATVLASLPPGTRVWLETETGGAIPVAGPVDSEVEAPGTWHFAVPLGQKPAALWLEADGIRHRWVLQPEPRLASAPWWFRLAPPWARAAHTRRVGLTGP